MVMAFEVVPGRQAEIAGALHTEDHTTRPQTVRREVHPRFLGPD
jgi:predicted NodU family carbamoyl transferase